MIIQPILDKLIAQQDLSSKEMQSVMRQIMSGRATDAQIAGFLIALRCKGETVDEIVAAVKVMRELVTPVPISGEHIIDTCGTGGDGLNTFNISTTCAFVVAAAGGQVAKHGNRSVSSRSGSADVLEAAGVNLNLSVQQVEQCVRQIGVGFLFAPRHHSAMKYAVTARQDMGIRTLFNLMGPLSNPAGAVNQLIGVFSTDWIEPLAHVLDKLASQHVLVVSAEGGLDEISIAGTTHIAELKEGNITRYRVTPEQFGFQRSKLDNLAVDNVSSSLNLMKSVLNNQPGACKDIVALNAGGAIYAANLVDSFDDGVRKALQMIESGAALDKLNSLVELTQQLSS